jgi:hypothetical protein
MNEKMVRRFAILKSGSGRFKADAFTRWIGMLAISRERRLSGTVRAAGNAGHSGVVTTVGTQAGYSRESEVASNEPNSA